MGSDSIEMISFIEKERAKPKHLGKVANRNR